MVRLYQLLAMDSREQRERDTNTSIWSIGDLLSGKENMDFGKGMVKVQRPNLYVLMKAENPG